MAAAPAAPVYGQQSLKVPPRWDPTSATHYPFRKWVQDVALWSQVPDLPAHQHAATVVLQQTGLVRELLRPLQPNVLEQGGFIDINDGLGQRHHTGLTIVLFMLQQKFMPLDMSRTLLQPKR